MLGAIYHSCAGLAAGHRPSMGAWVLSPSRHRVFVCFVGCSERDRYVGNPIRRYGSTPPRFGRQVL